MLKVARAAGAAASLGIFLLWAVLIFLRPYGSQGFGSGAWLVAAAMMALAGVGLVASLRGRPWLLLAVFALSFLPVGLYLLGTPGIFRWIGLLNLALLAAMALMLAGRRSSQPV